MIDEIPDRPYRNNRYTGVVLRQKVDQVGYGLDFQTCSDYLKVEDPTFETDVINALISASYDQVCAECNRDFLQADYSASIVSGSNVFLTSQDVLSVSTGSIENREDGTYVVFHDAIYTGPINYTVASGSNSVPSGVYAAQMLLVAHWYENRQLMAFGQAPTVMPFTVEAMLSPYKLVRP